MLSSVAFVFQRPEISLVRINDGIRLIAAKIDSTRREPIKYMGESLAVFRKQKKKNCILKLIYKQLQSHPSTHFLFALFIFQQVSSSLSERNNERLALFPLFWIDVDKRLCVVYAKLFLLLILSPVSSLSIVFFRYHT